jgi:hypothetical protein
MKQTAFDNKQTSSLKVENFNTVSDLSGFFYKTVSDFSGLIQILSYLFHHYSLKVYNPTSRSHHNARSHFTDFVVLIRTDINSIADVTYLELPPFPLTQPGDTGFTGRGGGIIFKSFLNIQNVPKRCIHTRLIFCIIICIHLFGTFCILKNYIYYK